MVSFNVSIFIKKSSLKASFLFTAFLFFSSLSYSNQCEFTAEVTPKERTETVKAIYKEMCEWFVNTFPSKSLNPDIPLNDVIFVESWDSIKYVELSDDTVGFFYSPWEKEKNEIVIHDVPQNSFWVNTPFWIETVLAHELFHYFTKSCCFDLYTEFQNIDVALREASAYWAQDQFIRRNSNKTLFDFIKEDRKSKKDMKEISDFHLMAYWFYSSPTVSYLYNVPLWFGDNPQKKFDDLVNGAFNMD